MRKSFLVFRDAARCIFMSEFKRLPDELGKKNPVFPSPSWFLVNLFDVKASYENEPMSQAWRGIALLIGHSFVSPSVYVFVFIAKPVSSRAP
jgi:hypothetical protein